jgi:hypothetical protein
VRAILGGDAALNQKQIRILLGDYQTPAELEAAYTAKRISKGNYDSKKKLFLQLDDAIKRETEFKEKQTQKQQKKPGGGTTNPWGR